MLKNNFNGRRIFTLLILIVSSFILISCNSEDKSGLDDNSSTGDISKEELDSLKSLSIDDIEEYIVESLDKTLESFDKLKLEDVELNKDKDINNVKFTYRGNWYEYGEALTYDYKLE